jgi:hypothetical protein
MKYSAKSLKIGKKMKIYEEFIPKERQYLTGQIYGSADPYYGSGGNQPILTF